MEAIAIIVPNKAKDNNNLIVSITMPSVEVGIVGGGTTLHDQKSCLEMINKENHYN